MPDDSLNLARHFQQLSAAVWPQMVCAGTMDSQIPPTLAQSVLQNHFRSSLSKMRWMCFVTVVA